MIRPMSTTAALLALILAFVLAVPEPTPAHIEFPGAPFPFYELTEAELALIDVRDGSIEAWESLFEPSLLAEHFYWDPNVGEGAQYDPEDLDFRIWLGWTRAELGNHIYVAVERIDDVYINEYEGGGIGQMWQHDSIEFRIDGDHSGGQYGVWNIDQYDTEEELRLIDNATAQTYLAIAESPDGIHFGYAGAGDGWVNRPPYGDAGGAAWGRDPNTSVIEMYLTPFDNCIWNDPEGSVVSTLEPGRIIHFAMNVPDFDTEPRAYRAFASMRGSCIISRYAWCFIDGILLAADPDSSPTAVQTTTWADIKASFAE